MQTQERFVKVHAAEALLELGDSAGVYEAFRAEEERFGDESPYCVGVWRVLARSAPTQAERQAWQGRIVDAFLDEQGPDRLHAVETLAKLSYPIPDDQRLVFEQAAAGPDSGLALFARWALLRGGDGVGQESAIAAELNAGDAIARLRAGYILRHLPALTESSRDTLFEAAGAESRDSVAHAYLIGSAFVVALRGDLEGQARHWHYELIRILQHGTDASQRAAACQALAESRAADDLRLLKGCLQDMDADVRIYAAYAIARIVGR